MNKKYFIAPLAAVAAIGGALALGGTAHAAVNYSDTSITASHGVVDQFTAFTAKVGTATLDGNPDYFNLAAAAHVNFAATGDNLGTVTYSVKSDTNLPSGITAVLSPAGGVLSLTPNGDPIVLPSNPVTITVEASDGAANAYDTVTLTPVSISGTPFAVDLNAASNTVQLAHGAVNNSDGTVTFAPTPSTGVTEVLGNAPAGTALVGDVLGASTAIPSTYHGLTVTAVEGADGPAAVETFTATVKGTTAKASAPQLYGGHAVSTGATREVVYFGITEPSWVKFMIVGPGAINGHVGWVNAAAGLNAGYYSGLEANHTYAVEYFPVVAQGSSTLVTGSKAGHVTFITNRP